MKFPYSTVDLPDGVVIGGTWPHTIITWPGGKSRNSTKPEYDLFQALAKAQMEIEQLRKDLELERMRLDWLLPRQHSHHTRQSIDKELSR